MTHVIHCRAQVSDACLDGQPTAVQFGEDMPLSEDGTFEDGTIVCDACYAMAVPFTPSGAGLNDELPDAIRHIREQREFLKHHENLETVVAEAEAALELAADGSSRWLSILASIEMAKAEMKARQPESHG